MEKSWTNPFVFSQKTMMFYKPELSLKSHDIHFKKPLMIEIHLHTKSWPGVFSSIFFFPLEFKSPPRRSRREKKKGFQSWQRLWDVFRDKQDLTNSSVKLLMKFNLKTH